jgi:hypothetical protein
MTIGKEHLYLRFFSFFLTFAARRSYETPAFGNADKKGRKKVAKSLKQR